MADLFFYGTLRDQTVLDTVSADPSLFKRAKPATLAGWHAECVRGATYPILMADGGPQEGLFVANVSGVTFERIKIFEQGYAQRSLMVRVAERTRKATVFVAGPALRSSGESWDLAAWQKRYKRAFMGKIF